MSINRYINILFNHDKGPFFIRKTDHYIGSCRTNFAIKLKAK